MVWQITKYHLFVCLFHSLSFPVSFSVLFSFFHAYIHLQHTFFTMAFVYAIMEMAFFCYCLTYHQQHFTLTRQYNYWCCCYCCCCCCCVTFHHENAVETTWSSFFNTLDENNNNNSTWTHSPCSLIAQSYGQSQCVRLCCLDLPLRMIVILWSILFSVSHLLAMATYIHLISIHLFTP